MSFPAIIGSDYCIVVFFNVIFIKKRLKFYCRLVFLFAFYDIVYLYFVKVMYSENRKDLFAMLSGDLNFRNPFLHHRTLLVGNH